MKSVMGTRHYMASELVYLKKGEAHLNPCHNWEKADVFSLGVLIFILRYGNVPFACADQRDPDYMLFVNHNQEFFNRHPLTKGQETSKEFQQLLQSMLWPYPKQRPTVKQLLE
jgi:serine/threonine protein kinase